MRRLAFGVLLSLTACGDAVVSAGYRGEPILRLTGQVQSVGPLSVVIGKDESALVSIFWNPDLSKSPPMLIQESAVSAAIQFPSTFEIRVFDPPSAAELVQSDGRFGVGILLVYIDKNKDGMFDDQDVLIGGNLEKAIVWATETIPVGQSPFRTKLPEGFSVVDQPFLSCMRPPIDPSVLAGGAPSGLHVQTCSSDSSCPDQLVCDKMFAVCVPKDSFKLTIGGPFSLDHISCAGPT